MKNEKDDNNNNTYAVLSNVWKPGAAQTDPKTPSQRKQKQNKNKLNTTSNKAIDEIFNGKQKSKKNIKSNDSTTPKITTPKNISSGNKNNNSSSAKRKLSGSTMNMRFMQRTSRINTTTSSSATKEPMDISSSNTPSSSSKYSDTKNPIQSSTIPTPQSAHSTSQQGQQEESSLYTNAINNTPNEEEDSSQFINVSSSCNDIYATNDLDTIGRRSFNGFNKAVEFIYNQSLSYINASTINDDGSTSTNRVRMSDEELIKQYEEHVKKRQQRNDGFGRGGIDLMSKVNKN